MRDPVTNPMTGDIWSWYTDRSPSLVVGDILPGCVWMNNPHDKLPMSSWKSVSEFLRWAPDAVLIKRAEDNND